MLKGFSFIFVLGRVEKTNSSTVTDVIVDCLSGDEAYVSFFPSKFLEFSLEGGSKTSR
jgi:hypothetical protein